MKKTKRYEKTLADIKGQITDPVRLRPLESCLENGASSWLTALPLKDHGFLLDINNHFGTVSTSGTTCPIPRVYRQNVYVGLTLRSIMPSLGQEVDLLLSDTTRFEILLLHFYQNVARMFDWKQF